jgi:hypothetical protein
VLSIEWSKELGGNLRIAARIASQEAAAAEAVETEGIMENLESEADVAATTPMPAQSVESDEKEKSAFDNFSL